MLIAAVTSVVITGRRMKGSGMFMTLFLLLGLRVVAAFAAARASSAGARCVGQLDFNGTAGHDA
jgi:hypothetical protein